MSNIGVVIQGPLISYGQGPNNVIGGFNVCDTVLSNLKQIKARGYDYIVCVWRPTTDQESMALKQLADNLARVLVLDLPDIFDPDHRYKHHYAIRQGINRLNKDCEYIIKIRNDMLMPDDFWDWLSTNMDHRLVVSELISPFYLGDFIYAGWKETVINFLNSILVFNNRIIHPSITSDNGLKYFSSKNKKAINLDNGLMYLYLFKTKNVIQQWNNFIASNINVIPQNIWGKIKWREKMMSEIINIDSFKFNILPILVGLDLQFLMEEYYRFYKNRNEKKYLFAKIASRMVKIGIKIHRLLCHGKRNIGKLRHKPSILARVACLGNDCFIMKHGKRNAKLYNQQKARVDLLGEWIHGAQRPQASRIKPYLMRADIYPFIVQQQEMPWFQTKNDIQYLLMDSFAELTDQKFTHRKEGWSFCCHYTDVNHTPEFEEEFECCGLLAIEEIERVYNDFFDWFEKSYPGKKIFFIHFPATLDNRPIYHERAKAIFNIMQKIESQRKYIYNIAISDENVSWHEDDNFPYHYGKDTYKVFIEEWRRIECKL